MFAVLLAVAASTANEPVHRGFYFHADLGFGYYNSSGGGNTISGTGGGLGVCIGGGVADNLALFGELFDAVVANPNINGTSTQNTNAGIGGLGVGVAYYVSPINLFLSGIVGFGRLITESNGTQGSSDPGLVARVGVGKEWMVSQSWGLGVAGYLNFGSNKDQGGTPTWTTVSPLVAFSATFF